MNTTVDTVLKTAAALAPGLAAADPKVAAIVELAPVVLQFLQSATQLQQAGVLSGEKLAALFADIGQGVQATHIQWAAMNAAQGAQA